MTRGTNELQATEGAQNNTAFQTSTHETSVPRRALESAEYFALAARATTDALRDWDVTSGQLAWPQGLDSLLGYTPSIVTHDIGFWERHVHPEDRVRIAAALREALAEAEKWSGEYRFRRADGSYVHLLERALILRDENGQAFRFIGSLMDITPRKQLQDQLLRSQKMEAFGQLAGGIAHDFNNFLTTILGYSDLLLQTPAIKGQLAKHISEIRRAAHRASTLTGQLLAFSRKHPLESRVVEVNSVVTNLERSLLRLLGENISVECHLHRASEPAHIKVDPGQLTQIILNLAVNARDAMPNGGRLTLGTSTLRIGQELQPNGSPDKLMPGEYVLITITDTGHGMSDEVKAHLFEPFFTTKDERRGGGLGLATSYGIVRQSGGHICVDSEFGRGTMVTLYLPKVPAPAPPAYKKSGGKKVPAGTETILVLEDDVAVRHLSVRVLRSLGYDVIEAASGDDAKRLIEFETRKKIDLLLTDMVMPLMSGRDFADWLQTASPHTRVIFISGYLDESLGAVDGNGTFFLPKPFDSEQLALKVREALDA
ncbi:MAG: PAS domain-containing protein [Verrucomicrobiaceae bacterium]|nr:PAS domain-containing protein [Verrucomicrobiaceae bacterium]